MAGAPRGLSRGVAGLAVAGLAALLLASGGGPALAQLWPQSGGAVAPRDSESQRTAARAAFAAGQTPLALEHARRSLAAMPWNQEALAVISTALKGQQALGALNLSASLGWRDPLTNARLIAAAFTENQPAIAAERIDAMGRTLGGERAAVLADQLLGRPGGVEALAGRAAFHLTQADWYLPWLLQPPANAELAGQRIKVLQRIESDDGAWQRRAVSHAAMGFAKGGFDDLVLDLWRATLARGERAGAPLYDPVFATLGTAMPLGGEWAMAPDPAAQAEPIPGGGAALSAARVDPGPVFGARADIARMDGRLIARWEGDEAAVRAFAFEVRCARGELLPVQRTLTRQGAGWEDSYAFAVPATCRNGFVWLVRAGRAAEGLGARLLMIDRAGAGA